VQALSDDILDLLAGDRPGARDAIGLISGDRVLAHSILFAHRHPLRTAAFQKEIITAFHGLHPRIVCEAFRKAAKSTIAEETLILGACLVEFKNALIIGASYDRACERLESVKHEFETNEDLQQIFGVLQTDISWATDKIILSNGVVIQAKGAGQSLRGVKHHAQPPDFVVIDDLEDEESVRTPGARHEMLRWVYKTLIAALVKEARIRFIGNRLDPDAVIVKVSNDPEWQHLFFPIKYLDAETGEWRATWPEGYDLAWCDKKEQELARLGLHEDWNQEYMCQADTPEARIFRPEHFANILKPRVRSWEATWAMVDPARSVGKRSATTAIVVWSWINNRLIVWDCLIGHWLPDVIIEKMLWVDGEYRPVAIGVEEDALNQFILQPLRQAQVKHGAPLPLRPMTAKRFTEGRGKEDFIKSLQPFFAAGEVEFAKPLPELQAQFLAFSTRTLAAVDGPNALAYALKMRPGLVMYEEFTQANITEEVAPNPLLPVWLVMNATQGYVTAALLQYDGRRLSIIADYVDEGDPGQIAGSMVRRAQLDAPGQKLRVSAPPQHFDQWKNVGLRAALARVPIDCGMGGDSVQGREEIRALFRGSVRGLPAIQVAHAARWTLNAFSGGYARGVKFGGMPGNDPEDNIYSRLMGGIESFCALTRVLSATEFTESDNIRLSADGRPYRSAMVNRDRRRES
jgi:hypothetical protein